MGIGVSRPGVDPVGLKDIAGSTIDPATKQKQDSIIALLQAIDENTDGLELKADTVNLNVDEVETKLDTVNTNLTSLISEVDGLEEATGTTADLETASTVIGRLKRAVTLLGELGTNTDGLEGLLTSVRDNTDALETKLDTLITQTTGLATEAKQDTTISSLTSLLTEMQQKLEAGQSIDVGNFPADFPDSTAQSSLAAIDADLGAAADLEATADGSLIAITKRLRTLLGNLDGKDFATQTTLASALVELQAIDDDLDVALSTRASEATLLQVRDHIDTVEAKLQSLIDADAYDSLNDRRKVAVETSVLPSGASTEATLATLLTEATFTAEDFASQTTLEAARALLATIDVDTGNLDVALSTRATEATVATLLTEATFTAEDFATQTTLEAARVLLASLDGKDFATQTTLAELKARADLLLAKSDFEARVNTLGQKTSAQSTPVVLPSDQTVPVSGPLTDAQLRATSVPVDTGLTQPTTPSDTQPVSAASLPLPSGASTLTEQQSQTTLLQGTQLTQTELWAALKTGNAPTLDHVFKMDAGAGTVYRYHAFATRGTATSADSWDIMRFEFNNVTKDEVVDIRVNEDMAWDNRVTGGTEGWS